MSGVASSPVDVKPTDPQSGLTSSEAAARLKVDGPNSIAASGRRPVVLIVLSVLREPMLALLAAGGVIYLLIGEPQDSIVLFAFAMLSIVITVVQETRTERVLEALRALTSPRARVIRDGRPLSIPSTDVVRGDIVVLGEGDRVAADALVLAAEDVQADESLLTGESVPVRKTAAATEPQVAFRPGGDDLPAVFAGSLIVRGKALARVTATGATSAIGKIGKSLDEIENEAPRLQTETRRLVFLVALLGGAVSLLAVVLYGLLRGDWLQGILAGLALGMSMLPEEFPVVLTVFMAMGAWRISQHGVLSRHASAIEALGSATVLCTDKTGTLTQNRMSIAELRLADGRVFSGEVAADGGFAELEELIEYGRMASAADPFDPMERALLELGTPRPAAATDPKTLAKVHGLRTDLLAVTQVWKAAGETGQLLVATKGAPEAVASLCRLDAVALAELRQTVNAMAERGLRVLAIAKARSDGGTPAETPRDYPFVLLGLVGFADPPRPGVQIAVEQLRSAGIRLIMVTGDHPTTALAIARAVGIDTDDALRGDELDAMDDEALRQRVKSASVFARIMPEQKLRIVSALKANGEIVAMTGDGVNDAPSLKAAHIGIAMGKRGTEVARQAADLVLLNDDFGSIVSAVQLGRRIYDNLRKSMVFILAVHVPIAGLAMLPLIFGLPLLLGPVHIALMEMVIDPTSTLVFEAEQEEDNVLRRRPRRPDERLFIAPLVVWALLQGFLVFAASAAIYVYDLSIGLGDDATRAMTFVTLILSTLALVLVDRSFSSSVLTAFARRNPALGLVAGAIITVLALAVGWAPARDLFNFGSLSLMQIGLSVGAALAVFVVLEVLKPLWRARLVGAAAI